MLIHLMLPTFPPAATTTVRILHATPGRLLAPATPLIDLTVDLSPATAHDCPPVSHYRLLLRDRAWLRTWLTHPGHTPPPGTPLALLTTEPDENLTGPPARDARIATAAILLHDSWPGDAG